MNQRRTRLDSEMVRRQLVASRTEAQGLIAAGSVVVDGVAVPKASSQVDSGQRITLAVDGPRYASRGGLKLSGALEDLGVSAAGVLALDAGAAHGGFTDVLLRAGAAEVIAVDVAYGQLAWPLRQDPRVTLLERTNVRHLTPEDIGGRQPSLVVADLSFISLAKVLPALAAVAAPDSTLLPMVKPQFEVGPEGISRGGVVRDPSGWEQAITSVADAARLLGYVALGVAPSRAPGPAGNVEFFLHLHRTPTGAAPAGLTAAQVAAALDAGRSLARSDRP